MEPYLGNYTNVDPKYEVLWNPMRATTTTTTILCSKGITGYYRYYRYYYYYYYYCYY